MACHLAVAQTEGRGNRLHDNLSLTAALNSAPAIKSKPTNNDQCQFAGAPVQLKWSHKSNLTNWTAKPDVIQAHALRLSCHISSSSRPIYLVALWMLWGPRQSLTSSLYWWHTLERGSLLFTDYPSLDSTAIETQPSSHVFVLIAASACPNGPLVCH